MRMDYNGGMDTGQSRRENDSSDQHRFQTTQWSVVMAAGRDSSHVAAGALEQLCRAYWFPLYAFVRRQGYDAHAAADLTQGFFAELLRRKDLKDVDPGKGKFRSYLLASLKHYLTNQRAHDHAQKRGGGQAILSLDFEQADQRFRLEPANEQTADSFFLKQWALALIEQARAAIREEYQNTDRAALFDALQPFLVGEPAAKTYREIAEPLGKTEGALKVAVHRLRQQFHRQIRQEIARTVASEDQIDDEIRDLFEALRA